MNGWPGGARADGVSGGRRERLERLTARVRATGPRGVRGARVVVPDATRAKAGADSLTGWSDDELLMGLVLAKGGDPVPPDKLDQGSVYKATRDMMDRAAAFSMRVGGGTAAGDAADSEEPNVQFARQLQQLFGQNEQVVAALVDQIVDLVNLVLEREAATRAAVHGAMEAAASAVFTAVTAPAKRKRLHTLIRDPATLDVTEILTEEL
jgi:hypothetical protein